MRKDKDFDHIDHWKDIHLECYCLLNIEYSKRHDKYHYELIEGKDLEKDDWEECFKKIPNPDYDPDIKPNTFPEGCKKEITIDCLDCQYVGLCEMDVFDLCIGDEE